MGRSERKANSYGQPTQQAGFRFLEDARDDDLVIAIMGRTGVGKSTFVNALCGEGTAVVGHGLESTTSTVNHYVLPHPDDSKRRILVVDTPGFDDTTMSDEKVLELIAVWLANSYKAQMKLAGLIYILDISVRFAGSEQKSYDIFQALCGEGKATKVVLATSKWDKLGDVKIGEDCEKTLMTKFWRDMYANGSTVHRLERSRELSGASKKESAKASAQKVIATILSQSYEGALAIQSELVDQHKDLAETGAGRVLAAGKEGKEVKEKEGIAKEGILNRMAGAMRFKFGRSKQKDPGV